MLTRVIARSVRATRASTVGRIDDRLHPTSPLVANTRESQEISDVDD